MRKNMKNKLLILLLLFTANFSFGQQISVQNNELKYRITGGAIKTAADKDIFQAKIDALSARIVLDSSALITGLNTKLTKSSNLSDLTNASTARTNLGLGTLATQSGTFTDKANINSQVFTGTPNLPTGTIGVTQVAGNSTTALATTAFVTTADNLKANIAGQTFTGPVTIPTLVANSDAIINGVTVGEGGGSSNTNTVLGLNAGLANSTGTLNFFGGANAGRFNTEGGGNTYLGNTAGNANTTGSANTAVGRDALRNIIISGNNTALGANAGRYLANGSSLHTNGDNSLFLGFNSRAAADNQTNQVVVAGANGIGLGSDTWVIGNNLSQFGRAWGNLLIGSSTNSGEALQVTGEMKVTLGAVINGLTIGRGGGNISSNTALGNIALNANLVGTDNTAVGNGALSLSTSTLNTAVGSSALRNATTGGSNTALGRSTLLNNIGGSLNVAIGRDAGRFIADATTPLTTVDNSILIGSFTYPNSNSETNEIVIGHNTVGLGSHTTRVGNSSTVQTHLNGSLTIGGNTTLEASAVADFVSTTKGFLVPRMTTTQRNAISSPANGLQVFDTTLNRLMIYGGGFWGTIGALSGSYSTTGAATTSFVVTIGATMPNTTYKVNVTPTSSVAADRFFVSQASKTTTQFTVTYLTPLTGSVTFDWSVFR